MAAPRIRKASNRKEFDNLLDEFIVQGYEVLEQGEQSAMLRKKTWGTSGGHLAWFLLTFWFTIGLGNLAYALFSHYSADQILLKIASV